MSFEQYFAAGVVFLYSLGTLGQFLAMLSKRPFVRIAANWLTLTGFALHTFLAGHTFAGHSLEELSSAYFLQLLAWCIILVYLCAWLLLRLRILAISAAPLALVLCAISMRSSPDMSPSLPGDFSALFFTLHISALFVSGALMALAFGAGVLFMYMNRKLKNKAPINNYTFDLPSLTAFDAVNRYAVIIGFPLYTLGLMAGFIWAPLFFQAIENPKVIVSLFVWALYALLFYERLALGYRGRKTAVMVIVIFAISALSLGIDYTVSHHSTLLTNPGHE